RRRLLGLAGHFRRLARDRFLGPGDGVLRLSLDLLDPLLGLCLDVGFLGQRRDRVAQVAARRLDVLPDLLGFPLGPHRRAVCALVLAHCTSSFALSVACSGTGGVACWTFVLPVKANPPATAANPAATINAASHAATAVASARIAQAVSAPSA